MEDFRPTKYKLRCVATGRVFEDDGLVLEDRQCNTPSLIRTEYEVKCIDIRSDDSGIYKFCDWLPVRRTLKGSAAPVTYKSEDWPPIWDSITSILRSAAISRKRGRR